MYSVEYINCRVCGRDETKFLGIRGSREYAGASHSVDAGVHMVTNIVRCRRCGFVYTNPLIISDAQRYNDPDDYQTSSSVGAERLFNFTLNLIERYSDRGKLLDIGCGKGEFLSAAKKRGWETYGVEPSENLARLASQERGIEVRHTLLKKAGYPGAFIDAAALNMALEHVDKPRPLLSEIRRVLRDGGFLFIEVPNMDSLMLKAATVYFRLRGKNWSPLLSPLHYPFHCYGYNISSITYLLNSEGFVIRKVLVRDSSLRGFRKDGYASGFERGMRAVITKLAGLLGRGDVLMVVAQKR